MTAREIGSYGGYVKSVLDPYVMGSGSDRKKSEDHELGKLKKLAGP